MKCTPHLRGLVGTDWGRGHKSVYIPVGTDCESVGMVYEFVGTDCKN